MMVNHEHGQRKTKNFSKYKLIYDALWVKEAVSYDKKQGESGFCTRHSASYQSRHEVWNISNIKPKRKS